MEDKEHYAIASILDAKYKRFFFRDADAFQRAKATLTEKLVQAMTQESNREDATEQDKDKPQSSLDKVMAKIIKRGQQESGDQEIEGAGMSANAAIQEYLSRPLCDNTFEFWKRYSRSTERAQKCLSDLARIYLTPPPTTTGMIKIMC